MHSDNSKKWDSLRETIWQGRHLQATGSSLGGSSNSKAAESGDDSKSDSPTKREEAAEEVDAESKVDKWVPLYVTHTGEPA